MGICNSNNSQGNRLSIEERKARDKPKKPTSHINVKKSHIQSSQEGQIGQNQKNSQKKSNIQLHGDHNKIEAVWSDAEKKERSLVHKNQGNVHFKGKLYQLAIEEYTKAIKLYDLDSVYFSNRALCLKFLGKFNDVFIDAEMSIRLDTANFKGIYLKGIALGELGKTDQTNERLNEGITTMRKALELVKSKNDQKSTDEASTRLNRMKKICWLKDKDYTDMKKAETLSFIKGLISNDAASSKQEQKDKIALVEKFVAERRSKIEEVPENYSDRITFEMIKEPVISPSGISYEKEPLIDHLKKVGNFDPMTRQKIVISDLIKNNTLKSAIAHFEKQNPWCYESGSPNDDYLSISLV